ncbi:hypothetical protein K1719_009498 [Acacia pycnantha]|nr:hypothetical protein K1719_009498 [Acacia pycnantha]
MRGFTRYVFECGKYGHIKQGCPLRQDVRPPNVDDQRPMNSSNEDGGGKKPEKEARPVNEGGQSEKVAPPDGEDRQSKKVARSDDESGLVTGDGKDGGRPFGKLQILRREFRGANYSAGLKKDINDSAKQGGDQDFSATFGKKIAPQRSNLNVEVQHGKNEIQGDISKDRGPQKQEWVQVGVKRKNVNKGKGKGKENRPPPQSRRVVKLGLAAEPKKNNEFSVLQVVEPNADSFVTASCIQPNDGSGAASSSFAFGTEEILHVNQLVLPNSSMGPAEGNNTTQDNGLIIHQTVDETVVHKRYLLIELSNWASQITGTAGNSWTLTVVYASPSCASRRALWDNLSQMALTIQNAWLIGGDLNGTMLHGERRSPATSRLSFDRDLVRWIDMHEMCDVGFVGPEFT